MTCPSIFGRILDGQVTTLLVCGLAAGHAGDHWDPTFSQAWEQVAVQR